MKKFGILVLALFAQMFFGQTMRFVYQATTMPDSTDLKSVKSELANLDISNGKSVFYAQNRMVRDSIMQRARQTQNFNMDRTQMENLRSNVPYIVEKDLSSQTVTYKDRIGRDNYTYSEKAPMVWKITPETTKIGDYKVQKAETKYGGRTWYAWFTTDLPYQDGPYKFSGLPGLIVKAQDKDGEYSFDLMQVKKIAALPTFDNRGQTISITRDKFLAMRNKYVSDPSSYMQGQRGGSFGGGNSGFSGGGGRGGRGGGFGGGGNRGGGGRGGNFGGGMSDQDRQQMRDRMLQDIKSNNNPIELR